METNKVLHPADETLVRYGLGKLDDTIADSVDKHLEQCPACRRRVEELPSDDFVARLREAKARPPVVPESESSRSAGDADRPLPAHESTSTLLPELARYEHYQIVRVLGRGGMGDVYLVRNTLMDRLEVLKVLNREMFARPGMRDRFLREIQSAAKLHHPNVVTAYSALPLGDGLAFAMEYVEGSDLAQLVRERGILPVADACHFIYQAAQGLQHAYERGMIHRDIKPGNLILGNKNQKAIVKILDFGLAKVASVDAVDGDLTQQGQLLGTPDFMAPEQTLDALKADIRSDIYSLGCTFHYLLTGTAPFCRPSLFEVLKAHQSAQATPLNHVRPEVPAELAQIVATMMAKDPDRRFQTPQEVAQALLPFLRPRASRTKGPRSIPDSNATCAGEKQSTTGLTNAGARPAARKSKAPASRGDVRKSGPRHPGVSPAARKRPPWVPAAVAIGALLFGAVLLLAGVLFKYKTTNGIVAIKNLPPGALVFADGNEVTVHVPDAGGPATITLLPGSPHIEVKKDGLLLYGETVKIATGTTNDPIEIQAEAAPAISTSPAPAGPANTIHPKTDGKGAGSAAPPLSVEVPPAQQPPFSAARLSAPSAGSLPATIGAHQSTAPLSPLALVTQPAALKGLRSWTIETTAQRGVVTAVAYHPQGHWLATGGTDGTIRIWELDTARLARGLLGHQAAINLGALAWSRDGRILASGGADRTVRLWDATSGTLLRVLPVAEPENSLAWAPDGKTLAVGTHGPKSEVGVWDAVAGKSLYSVKGFRGVYAVAWSPDGKTLACGGDDTILVDGATGKTLRKLEFQVDAQGLTWSPDGQFLAAASRDKKLRLWRVDTGKVVRTLEPTANPESALHVVAWSPDGNYLACGWSQGIALVEGGTGKVVRTIAEGLPWDTRMSLSWSPDGTTLAVGLGRRAEVALLDRDSGERRQALPGSLQNTTNVGSPSAWSPDGSRIALVMEDDAKAYGIWDVASGKQSLRITVGTRCVRAAWSPDGATLAFGESPDGSIHLANASTGKEIRSFRAPKPVFVRQIAWSPDSKWLAAGGRDHLVQIWNTDAGQLVRELTGHHSSIVSLAWSPDGKLVAGGAEDDPFRIWDVRSGQCLHELKRGCTEDFACSAFSPDGKVLATADNCSIPSVCLWDVSSGQRIGTGNSKVPDIRALAWLPGGTCATFGEDGQLHFWGAAGYLVRTLKLGPTAGDYYLSSFSPSGDVLARGWLNSVWFHQATTGRCLGVWLRLTGDRYVTVAPDGSFYNSSQDDRDLFCVAQIENGQETLTLDEFRAKYGWKNDSDHVRLMTK